MTEKQFVIRQIFFRNLVTQDSNVYTIFDKEDSPEIYGKYERLIQDKIGVDELFHITALIIRLEKPLQVLLNYSYKYNSSNKIALRGI